MLFYIHTFFSYIYTAIVSAQNKVMKFHLTHLFLAARRSRVIGWTILSYRKWLCGMCSLLDLVWIFFLFSDFPWIIVRCLGFRVWCHFMTPNSLFHQGIICPTMDERLLFHPQLYNCFAAQSWREKAPEKKDSEITFTWPKQPMKGGLMREIRIFQGRV